MSTFDSERPEDIQERVWRQLTALIARAQHPNTPPAEAELCDQQIERLMIKWQISDAMAAATQKEPTVIIEEEITIDGRNSTHKGLLLGAVAEAFNCRTTKTKYYRKSAVHDFTVIGRKQDVAIVWTLFEHLLTQLNTNLMGLPLAGYSKSFQQGYRKGYISAFAARVGDRLEVMYREEVVASGAGTELVLTGIKDAVDRWVEETYPNLGKANRLSSGSLAGQLHGDADAKLADIFLPGARFNAAADRTSTALEA